jgi:two-component system sensor histidine kinase KdpD
VYGTLRAAFDAALPRPQFDLLKTCVSQAAMALERIDLTARANKSRQFEEADKLKTAILQAVSHDLRTPITIIKSSASNLQHAQETMSFEQQQEVAATIEQEADVLNKLVGNLLDMSRLQAGELALNSRRNSLEEIASEAAARIWDLTQEERITLNFGDELMLVDFDYDLILQAVLNMIENALRYEPQHRCIEICGEISGETAILKIINHGPNIPEDVKVQMMQPFYSSYEGHIGLGLPIARGIIEAHQGRLWVEDTPGGGATFVFALPYQKDEGYENFGR